MASPTYSRAGFSPPAPAKRSPIAILYGGLGTFAWQMTSIDSTAPANVPPAPMNARRSFAVTPCRS